MGTRLSPKTLDRLEVARMLTREEAQQLLLNRLKDRQDARDHFVEERCTVERAFGWLFFVALVEPDTVQPGVLSYRSIIVQAERFAPA